MLVFTNSKNISDLQYYFENNYYYKDYYRTLYNEKRIYNNNKIKNIDYDKLLN